MVKSSVLTIAPVLIFAAVAAVFVAGTQRKNSDALPSALTQQPAPAIRVSALSDKTLLSDAMLRAPGVKLLNVWASWCAPCRVEHPTLTALAEEGVPIFGINYKDNPENALSFLRQLGDPYTAIGVDESGRTALDWGVYGVPETFVVTADGRIAFRFAGPITQRVLRERLRPAMEKAAR
ncbi:MAG: DsbE family thiol:disulfide interchange protein [Pseudomonadota bacterium]